MNKNINVLYLVWGENVISNGILQNQVLQLTHRLNQSASVNVELLLGVPVLNYFLKGVSRKQVSNSLNVFRKTRSFHTKRIFLPTKFYIHPILIPFLILPYVFFLNNKVHSLNIDVLHCRSYPATLLAYLTKKILGAKYKIVFDARGLYCEEAVMRKAFHFKGWSYRTWRKIEVRLLNGVDCVVVVSKTFAEIMAERTTNKNICTIHTSTNEEIFSSMEKLKKDKIKKELGIKSKTLVYLGGLESNGWYSIERLAFVFSSFSEIFPYAQLLIISHTEQEYIFAILKQLGVSTNSVIVKSSNSPQTTNELLNAADLAVAAFQTNRNEIEQVIDYTVISSKTGEYLSVGLPLIYDKKMGAAAQLIEKHQLGVTFDDNISTQELKKSIIQVMDNYPLYVNRCVKASKTFSTKEHVKKYIDIYIDICKADK